MKKQATKDALELVKEILSRDFYVEEANITESADLVEDLGLDSLDLVELAMNLEEAYELPEISDVEMEKVKTVADVVSLIKKKQPAANG